MEILKLHDDSSGGGGPCRAEEVRLGRSRALPEKQKSISDIGRILVQGIQAVLL
jgi:hypothetical protein